MTHHRAVVLGGGMTGLSAGCFLSRRGVKPTVIEASSQTGGLARTEKWEGCLFDLGGHRFHTKDARVMEFVKELMDGELLRVPRSSKIFIKGRYFDYPLRPLNALTGMGLKEAASILGDYVFEKAKNPWRRNAPRSLREKVVRDFGKRLFEIFFRDYSEKVWGLSCDSISADWIAKRIQGLSLGSALRNALIKKDDAPDTLADSFYYPSRGIGRISDRLGEEIERCGSVLTGTRVTGIHNDGSRIRGVTVNDGNGTSYLPADSIISTIPLPSLLGMLGSRLPEKTLRAAAGLRYRDLIVAALLVDRPQVTDQTWIYFPERKIPFGRLHEPKNWSIAMAPPGKSVLIVEYFCFAGDRTWETPDESLANLTASTLESMGFFRREECYAAKILRIPKAYPLFDVEYGERLGVVKSYLERFENLYCAGRTGSFRYLNMDEAIASGLEAARKVLADRMRLAPALQAGAGR